MRKETRIDQVEVLRNGMVHVRLKKILVEADKSETTLDVYGAYHRFVVEPGVPISASDRDAINASLLAIGAGAVPDEDFEYISTLCNAAHTERKVADFKAQKIKAYELAKMSLSLK